jgi:hypothetical protein
MTNKTMMMALAVAAVLIAGTFSLGSNAFAVESGDQIKIKTKKGPATCTTQGEESCGEGKAKSQFRLLTTNVKEGSASGIAQGEIFLDWFNRTKGISCILPDIDEQRCVVKTVNNGNLSFEYGADNSLTITGIMTDQNGNSYDLIATGDVGEFKKGEAAIDLSIQMIIIDVTSAGFEIEIIVKGEVILVPIDG